MSQKRTAPAPATTVAPAAVQPGTLLLAALALGVYLVVFYFWPISGRTGSDFVLRRGHVFVSLFLGEEIIGSWFAGASWHSIGQRVEILSYAAAILLVATSLGWLALKCVRVDGWLTRLETFVYSAGVGLCLVSLATLLLGLAGVMQRGVFVAIGAVVIVLAAAVAFGSRRRGTSGATAGLPSSVASGQDSALPDEPAVAPNLSLTISVRWLWLAVPFVVAIVLGAMLPPVDFDVREYHLQAPKEFYQNGRITFLSHNVYANMPLGAEMLSLAAMIVCGDWWLGALVGKTVIAAFAPLTAILLFAAGKRFVSTSVGTIAALVYISIPWMALVAMQGLVDGVVAFYLLAALTATLSWRECLRRGTNVLSLAALAGFLSGAAVGVKYPAVVFSALPIITIVKWESLRQYLVRRDHGAPSFRQYLVAPLVCFCAMGVACGPWFAKNAVLTGNPTYPLLYELFGGQSRDDAKNQQWTRVHSPPNYDLADLARRAGGVTFTSDWLSPLVAPLAALSLVFWKRMSLVRTLAIYFVYVFVTWWLFTHRIDRFWIPALPLAALAAGIGATWTAAHPWRLALSAFLGLGLFGNFAMITSGILGDNRFSADLDALRVDAETTDPWHKYLNEHADEVSRVLLVGDAQPLDLDVPADYNTVFDDSLFELLARDKSAQEVHQALVDRGISHVYVAWGEVARYRSPGNYGFTKFVDPSVFQELVKAGVLEEQPPIDGNPGQMFRVVPGVLRKQGGN